MTPKSNVEKLEYARLLLKRGITYREIQKDLKDQYGSGMSNNTLQRLYTQEDEITDLENKITALANNNMLLSKKLDNVTDEMERYKRLYFELLDSLNKKFKEL